MASSSNPIADSATTTSSYYDAFINHRGPDVKETLATQLYKRLIDYKLRAFLDKDELQEGDNIPSRIKGAIQSASIHIAIFSPRYAESSWCLNELLLMLESGKTIIPIFYRVEPSELRWTLGEKGVYARSLRILEDQKTIDSQTRRKMPRYDSDTIGKWRTALSQVADMKGFEAEAYNSNDSQLVDRVVKRVLETLPETLLDVSKYPTGLEHKIKDFERTLLLSQQISGEKSRVVGIVGLGGVGKTTLAKEFCNRERSNYDRSCFLFDVRETEARTSLISLQSTLVNKLSQSNVQIHSTAEGKGELRKRVSSCHASALVILDDVDHIRQLDALVFPIKDALRSPSLILVTSRNKDVLVSFGIAETSIFQLKGLDPQHSKELFCRHALGQPNPPLLFERVVGKFLDACQGLPLSLQVIGALLYGQPALKDWEEQLLKISRIPPSDIQSVLKISYDSLDEEEKQMFLDISCFFVGQEFVYACSTKGMGMFRVHDDTDSVKRLWDGSGWGGSLGLRKLQNRCLVDVQGKYLSMHDHLRDLGRDLAQREPLGGHRLWQRTENLPHTLSDLSAVRGITCIERRPLVGSRWGNRNRRRSSDQNPVELGNRSITICRLELLRTEGDCLKDILNRVQSPEHLIWLSCYSFPYASLPRWIPMERLTVLQLQGHKLKSLWRQFEAPRKLRELRITAPFLNFPKSIGQLKFLKKIVVNPPMGLPGGVPLETLPDEFCHLQCLEYLELRECSKLQSLPESFGNLKSLQHLSLAHCSNLRTLPDSFGNLKSLQHLILLGCLNLRTLPDSFGNLINLEYLSLFKCSSLTMSSDTLGNITKLQYISMSHCKKIEVLPPQIIHQRYVTELSVDDTILKELPSAIADLRNLETLKLGGPLLETLPVCLGRLSSLKHLRICSSKQLKHFPDSIRELTGLETFMIAGTGLEFLPPCMMALNNLKSLDVNGGSFREWPFKSLGGESETVTDSTRVRVLSRPDVSIECLRGLQSLTLHGIKISEVAFCKGVCPNLQHLYINCSDIVEIGTLPYSLRKLALCVCPNLKKIEGLCGVEELSGHATLKSLETLMVSHCEKLKSILGLQQLTKLRVLQVSVCAALEELQGIEHLMSLGKVDVERCPNLQWGEGVLEHLRRREEEGILKLLIRHENIIVCRNISIWSNIKKYYSKIRCRSKDLIQCRFWSF